MHCRQRISGLARIKELHRSLEAMTREREEQKLVLRISRLLLDGLDPESLFKAISSALWERTQHDYITLTTTERNGSLERFRLLDTPFAPGQFKIGGQVPEDFPPYNWPPSPGGMDLLGPEQIALLEPPKLASLLQAIGTRSICTVPLFSRGKLLGALIMGSQKEHHFREQDRFLLEHVAGLLALAIDNALTFQDLRSSRDRLEEEKLYLEEEARQDFSTQELIGASHSILEVLQQIDTVAPSNATVLLLGETGTGKELLARAIHERSQRSGRTFVRLNCSAIPMGLVESELFGHERGAFTGAIARKIGRFELAHQGSLFLDEIGDLPIDLQPKLLRAIQEREFERLGGTQTLRVDVRLIAATHQNLARMVEEGTFRKDLFYRLNVFPIHVPALRERREDIPNLVRYFTQKYARAMDKRIQRIPGETMEVLVRWPWPGNIRELQNVIERSVILSQGPELQVPLGEMAQPAPVPAASNPLTLDALERQGILEALEASGGRVGGPDGAATRLGLKRTTLYSKMKRLGLDRGQ